MLPSIVSFDELSRLLQGLLRPETDTIRQVEAALRRGLAQPTFICDLFEQIQRSPSAELRQLAAVLVRRRIGAQWTKLEQAVRQQLQAILLSRLGSEPERLVRRSLTSVVSVVARHALPRGLWPELFSFLAECSRSAAAEHRELSMQLLASLLEAEDVIDACLRPHFPLLATTIQALLGDREHPPVRQAALKAIGAWVATLLEEPELLELLRPLLPHMLELGGAAATGRDDETLTLAFEIFYDMLEAEASAVSALLAPHIHAILDLALSTATATVMEEGTRIAALNLASAAVENKRKLLVKQRLVAPLVARLFEACADPESALPDADDDDDDDDDVSVHRRAAQVLHSLACHVPSKHAVPPILECVGALATSAEACRRRAAIVGLAMAAEGCQEPFADALDQLLPVVFAACADGVQGVREAACVAIGVFAQHLQPEIISHYEQVLPHIFMVRALRGPRTQRAPRAHPARTKRAP